MFYQPYESIVKEVKSKRAKKDDRIFIVCTDRFRLTDCGYSKWNNQLLSESLGWRYIRVKEVARSETQKQNPISKIEIEAHLKASSLMI